MNADWTTARVVRDSDGGLWTSGDGDWWHKIVGPPSSWSAYSLARDFGPLVPVLDADGLPVVTTVGDLTARHIGRRVRLDEHYDAKLETIFAHEDGEMSLNFTHPDGFTYGCSRSIDTPCEVLA